jgi:predicted carbohydrate-binding protein with CBM5 and CBM33 domain
MHLRTRLSILAAGTLLAPLIAVLITPSPASAHGWITSPPSRQDQCATGVVASCGDIQYEPQSVEAPKGARSCSGGGRFTVLNDENKGWRVTSIGSTTTFTWKFTAMHRTTNWEYYVDGALRQTVNGNAAQPPATVSHTITGLPSGRHKILAIWNIYDTANAFYSCVDVNVGGGGGGNPPPPPPPPPGGGSCAAAWSAAAAYAANTTVSYGGHNWSAKWWTQGETPGTTGEWGVWKDLGAC